MECGLAVMNSPTVCLEKVPCLRMPRRAARTLPVRHAGSGRRRRGGAGRPVAVWSVMSLEQPIRHILVAHDFERSSDAALDYALALAKSLGARVTILHTYEIPSMGAPE